MLIRRLQLQSFRRFDSVEIDLRQGFNLLTGDNGSGKTSVLEALHLLAHGRSFRGRVRDGLIRQGEPALSAYAEWEVAGATHRAGLRHAGGSWEARLDGEDVRQLGQLCEALAVITFQPGSHALVDGSSEGRRRYLDWGLFHVEHGFMPQWRRYARALKQRFPAAQVEEDRIFITDGPIWTSAGMSAGLDLALGMIENDFGTELSRAVARKLVVYHRRGGGQSQHSVLLELDARSDRIQNALTFARGNLRATLSVEELAQAAHLSTRQFSRAFREETGQSPAKAVESLRVEAARVLIEQSRYTMDEVAAETGFVDTERMRRAFLRAFGQPPQSLRRNARGGAD